MKKVPVNSIDLIEVLKKEYLDVFDVSVSSVGTPEYWKHAGVIELLRNLDIKSKQEKDL